MKRKMAILGAALMGMSLLSGCGSASTRLPDYSEYVTLGNYKELSYKPKSVEITDEDVEDGLDAFLQEQSEEKSVTDRGAQIGDSINIDYVGSVDGVEFEGGNTGGNGTDIILGESGYIDNFDEQLVGMKPGETKDVHATFPDPYENNPDLSGKAAVFKTTLNTITETVIPELTDELVAANTSSTTVDEYKAQLRAEMEEDAKEDAEDDAIDQLIAAAAENATFSAYPENEIKTLIDDTIAEIKQMAAAYSIDYSYYIALFYQCETEEEFEKFLADSAKEYMEHRMVVCEIAKKEKISVTNDDIKTYVDDLVKEYSLSGADEVYESYTDADLEYMILVERVGKLLKETAVEAEASDEDSTGEDGSTDESDEEEDDADDDDEAVSESGTTTEDVTSESDTTTEEASGSDTTTEDGTSETEAE